MGLFNFEDGSRQKEEIKPLKEDPSEEVKKPGSFFNEKEYDEDQAELASLDLDTGHREADKIMRANRKLEKPQ